MVRVEQEEELARGSYISAAIAVGGLGVIGLFAGGVLAYTGLGDPSMVETRGMVATALVLCAVGAGLWWGGTR